MTEAPCYCSLKRLLAIYAKQSIIRVHRIGEQ